MISSHKKVEMQKLEESSKVKQKNGWMIDNTGEMDRVGVRERSLVQRGTPPPREEERKVNS